MISHFKFLSDVIHSSILIVNTLQREAMTPGTRQNSVGVSTPGSIHGQLPRQDTSQSLGPRSEAQSEQQSEAWDFGEVGPLTPTTGKTQKGLNCTLGYGP